MQENKLTKVPSDILAEQREAIAARDPGTDKYLADAMKLPAGKSLEEILKHSLVTVTDALKSNANALHKDRHHPLPFAVCQSDECVCNQTIINNTIKLIARASELEPKGEVKP